MFCARVNDCVRVCGGHHEQVVLECEKRSVGRQIDLDSFLLFMLEMWDDEQHRIEERMRSVFTVSRGQHTYRGGKRAREREGLLDSKSMFLSIAHRFARSSLILNVLRWVRARMRCWLRLFVLCPGKQLFVGSDANADGNLDFEEFVAMIKHIKTNRPRRELLKMFSELTLHRCVCI